MVWNAVWPDGTKSVKTNTPTGQANTTYIKTTQNVNHFWDRGANFDGCHNRVDMPKQVGNLTPLNASMDGVTYYKQVSASIPRVETFYCNSNGVYQVTPSFKTGDIVSISDSSYTNITTVDNNSYGYIYMFGDTANEDMSFGFFKCIQNVVQCYSSLTRFDNSNDAKTNLVFGNGSNASGANIRARRSAGPNISYQYRIVYWGK